MRSTSAFVVRGAIHSIGAGMLLASCTPDHTDPGTGATSSLANPGTPGPARADARRTLARLASATLASTKPRGSLDSLVREPQPTRRLPVPVRPPSGDRSDVPERFRAFAETIEAERLSQGIPGVAVGIVERGELSFARGFGTKDPAGTERVRPSTLFRLASNTKPFTAISVLQQVEGGALAIDDALVDVLPTFGLDTTPEQVPAITLRQLLSHTSGFADYLDIDVPDEQKNDAALAEFLLGPFRGVGYLQSPPGALFSYSNVGYSLLGLVAEVQTGVPVRTLVRERIWKPLGMRRTFFEPSDVLDDGDYALGVCLPDQPDCAGEGLGSVFAPDSYDAPSSAPAAAAWSSVLDLARWARFLVHGNRRVLGESLRAEMARPQVSTRFAGDILSYGLGLQHQSLVVSRPEPAGPVQFHAATEIYHGGALPGFRSVVSCVPSIDYCFIALANYEGADFFGMETAALRLIELPEAVPPPDLAPIPERFPEYAGTYADPFALGVLTVTLDEAGLHVDWPLLDELAIPYGRDLIPSSVDNFSIDLDGGIWPLTFLAGEDGGFDYLRTIDRYVATRVQALEVPAISGSRSAARGGELRRALARRDF
jgi:CubicO group peptidase (beta-lactamase class C family)